MKKILLSFNSFWYEKLRAERRFLNIESDSVMNLLWLIYVSRPVMAVTGLLMLGRRISLDECKKEYEDDKEIYDRVCDFAERNNYVIPVKEFIPTTSITLKEIRCLIPNF